MNEAARPLSRLLAAHQRRRRTLVSDLYSLCRTAEQASQGTEPSLDAARKTLEPTACRPRHQLPGFQLVGVSGCLFQVPLHPPNQFNIHQDDDQPTGGGFCPLSSRTTRQRSAQGNSRLGATKGGLHTSPEPHIILKQMGATEHLVQTFKQSLYGSRHCRRKHCKNFCCSTAVHHWTLAIPQ